ncbi:uncharacterized protein LOC122068630 [Macadamia integrifolia]|uniref:uncharacterized protein LOC122068630 n=1 Tax=Macadamia integrifolia TaxID=60698 RepID=UPI001C4F9A36|nr:uncharacterized protein LOC122068630 [Macadamia integrifolia]XP_042488433.1 uncharacterized protein LOC122068630 [Macadamia integrifolia]
MVVKKQKVDQEGQQLWDQLAPVWGQLEAFAKQCRAEEYKALAAEKRASQLADDVSKQLLAHDLIKSKERLQGEVVELQEDFQKRSATHHLAVQALTEQHHVKLKEAEERSVERYLNSQVSQDWFLNLNTSSFNSKPDSAVNFILKKYPPLDLSDYEHYLPPLESFMLLPGQLIVEVGEEVD